MNNLDLGLKDFFASSIREKTRPKHFLRQLRWELRYAWRRAWIGYDDVDVFSYFSRFATRTILALEKIKEDHVGVWWVPEESEHYNDLGSEDKFTGGRVFSREETDIIIETMIWHLKMTDEDFVEKQLYGKNIYDDDYEVGCRNVEDYKKIGFIMNQNKDAFMKLFSMFYYDLWD